MDIPADALVRAAMERLGTYSPTKLAGALHLGGQHDPQRVTRWRDGISQPDYAGTIALLRLGGWLKEAELEAALHRARAAEAFAEAAEAVAETEPVVRRASTRPPSPRKKASG